MEMVVDAIPVMNQDSRHDDLLENAVYFEKGSDGVFNQGDYILFYGQGPDIWTYDETKEFFNRSVHDYCFLLILLPDF